MAVTLNPYLGFPGNARQALEFYHEVFGGELTLSTFADIYSGGDPAQRQKIMHGQLVSGSLVLMGADTPASRGYTPGDAISVSLSGDDEATLCGYWEKLAEEGTATLPLKKAPWGDMFGMVTDKFGVSWMVNIAGVPD